MQGALGGAARGAHTAVFLGALAGGDASIAASGICVLQALLQNNAVSPDLLDAAGVFWWSYGTMLSVAMKNLIAENRLFTSCSLCCFIG